jgi:cytochrome c551/c552
MKALIALTLLATSLPAAADRLAAPKHAAYQEECGACHLAFPPALLDARSWQQVMDGRAQHFGTDASLDDARRRALADYLSANAGGRKIGVTADAAGRPLLRITETAYFQRKHRKIEPAAFRRPAIGSAANCVACHPDAAAGDFEDERVRIPR